MGHLKLNHSQLSLIYTHTHTHINTHAQTHRKPYMLYSINTFMIKKPTQNVYHQQKYFKWSRKILLKKKKKKSKDTQNNPSPKPPNTT